MAELTIRLLANRDGAEIFVALSEDLDGLPHEHEARHRELVQRLLGGERFLRRVGEERVTVERVRPAREPALG